RLRRVVLGHRAATTAVSRLRPLRDDAVDARIGEIDGHAVLIDEIATDCADGRISLVTDIVRVRIAARLRADQVFLFGLSAALLTLAKIEAEACGQGYILASSNRLIDG